MAEQQPLQRMLRRPKAIKGKSPDLGHGGVGDSEGCESSKRRREGQVGAIFYLSSHEREILLHLISSALSCNVPSFFQQNQKVA